MAKKKTSKSKEKVNGGAVVALAAVVAAAAGTYFLYGSKDAKKNKKAVKSWALKAKGEVLEKLETLKGELNEDNYHKIVDSVMVKYKKLKKEHSGELDEISKEIKGHWKNIKKHLK